MQVYISLLYIFHTLIEVKQKGSYKICAIYIFLKYHSLFLNRKSIIVQIFQIEIMLFFWCLDFWEKHSNSPKHPNTIKKLAILCTFFIRKTVPLMIRKEAFKHHIALTAANLLNWQIITKPTTPPERTKKSKKEKRLTTISITRTPERNQLYAQHF